MRHYEIVFMVHPDQSEQVPGMIERYTGSITEAGGTIHRLEDWGRRQMAYPINKFMEGIYVLAHFNLDAKDVLEMNRTLTIDEDILRFLITKK